MLNYYVFGVKIKKILRKLGYNTESVLNLVKELLNRSNKAPGIAYSFTNKQEI